MISDKERSEVAKSLRSVAKVAKRRDGSGIPNLCAAWMALSTAIMGRIAFCNTSDAFNALANLIEPNFHYDEYAEFDFVADKINIVRKAYVVSICDGEFSCELPMWVYPTREAALKKAREYTEGKHDNAFKKAYVCQVEVMDE